MRIINNKPVDTAAFAHLFPFKTRHMEIRGHRYHYVDEGAGEPVLMIHGNPTWSFYYRRLIQDVSRNRRAIAVDHIGCGLSDKPSARDYDYQLDRRVSDLAKLVEGLGITEKITLVVHDWGGMIGMAYALRNPSRIARIVVTNTAGFFPPGGKGLPKRLWALKYLLPFAVPAVLGGNLFSRAALYMAPAKRLSKAVKKGLTAPYNSWRNRIATLKFVQDIPMREGEPSYDTVRFVDDNLKALSGIPMMILWGRHDFVFDMDYYTEWRRRFPEAEAHLFDSAGHYLFEDEPDRTSQLVSAFLDRHAVSP